MWDPVIPNAAVGIRMGTRQVDTTGAIDVE